jgi:DNA gyrase subunit B
MGVQLDLSTPASTTATADRLRAALLNSGEIRVDVVEDSLTDTSLLRIVRRLHGIDRLTTVDRDFVESGEYQQIHKTAELVHGLLREGARIVKGNDQRPVTAFRPALEWLLAEAKRSVSTQRYKGLGEMNPDQLWETTMDPSSRRLLRAQIEDSIAADEIFTTLMGDVVEPRRAFIESNALGVRNLDV